MNYIHKTLPHFIFMIVTLSCSNNFMKDGIPKESELKELIILSLLAIKNTSDTIYYNSLIGICGNGLRDVTLYNPYFVDYKPLDLLNKKLNTTIITSNVSTKNYQTLELIGLLEIGEVTITESLSEDKYQFVCF